MSRKDILEHPCYTLMRAIVVQGVLDCYSRERHVKDNAKLWFKDDTSSFSIFCDWFGWDEPLARGKFVKFIENNNKKGDVINRSSLSKGVGSVKKIKDEDF